MSLDKFSEGGMLQKEMERLEIEDKNGETTRYFFTNLSIFILLKSADI